MQSNSEDAEGELWTGNAFSDPLPSWLPMQSVKFLSVRETFWDEWSLELIEAGCGVVALAVFAAFLTHGKVHRYYWFTPQQPVVHVLVFCTKVLGCWSLMAVVLIPIYGAGADYFGKST